MNDASDQAPVYNAATVGADSILLVDDTYVLRERLSVAMHQRGFRLVRYADDAVVLCASAAEAQVRWSRCKRG